MIRLAAPDTSGGGSVAAQEATTIAQDAPGGTNVLTVHASSDGRWGNSLRTQVDYANVDGNHFNLTVTELAIQNGRRVVVSQEMFQALSMNKTDPNYVSAVVKAGSDLITVDDPVAAANRPDQSGLVSTVDFAAFTNPVPPQHMHIHAVLATTSTADALPAKDIDIGAGDINTATDLANRLEAGLHNAYPGAQGWAQATVKVVGATGAAGQRVQILAGPSAPDGIFTISAAAPDPLVAPHFGLVTAGNVSAYQLGSTTGIGAQAAGQAGTDGVAPGATELIGNAAAVPPTGLYALDKVPVFNILCLPRLSQLSKVTNPITQADVDAVVAAATAYCNQRRAVFIFDTPNTITNVQQMQAWAQTTAYRDDHVVMYFPRVLVPDPLNKFRLADFGASGTMAGLYSRFDDNPGVFRAAAGTDAVLRGVSALQYKMSDAENGVLNPLGINCLRTFDIFGNLSWGARTLEGADQLASPYKYLGVRRVANFIEETLYEQTKWVIFQPNDEPLWSQIRLNVGVFMNNLFRKGYFQGQTARDAYFVKCDGETTRQNDIDLGVVNLVVGFAPLKPAEFLIIRIQQIAGQLQT